MKLKNILIPCIVFCTTINLQAQDNTDSTVQSNRQDAQRPPLKDRLVFNLGGNFWIGTTTSIGLMPQVGYKVTDRLIAGVGLNFQYYKNLQFSGDPFMIYGGNVFTRYHVHPSLFLQTEYQVLQYNENLGGYALIGGGYTPSTNVYISAYYLLHAPTDNAYGAPYLVRVGFMF